jgi:hypothetical protein
MKQITLLLILFSTIISAQKKYANYILDPEGNEIKDRNLLYKKYPENSMGFRKLIDSGMVYQYNSPRYIAFNSDYKIVKLEIEKITNTTFSDSTIFIINFNYIDDNCSDWFTNIVDGSIIKSRKHYLKPQKKLIEKNNNVIYLTFFEKGITLKNKPKDKNEYFFSDKDGFFRKYIFLSPTLCGSFGIIKPNGQILTRNGEYRPLNNSV